MLIPCMAPWSILEWSIPGILAIAFSASVCVKGPFVRHCARRHTVFLALISQRFRASAYCTVSFREGCVRQPFGVAFRARMRQAHPYRIPEGPLFDRTAD